MIRRRAWCERGEQTDFDALVQHVFGHGAIGCPFPARDGNQPAWADQHSVFAADFFRVFALFVVGWPHQWPQPDPDTADIVRSEEHTSELQSLMRISYAVFCLTKKKK